MQILPSITIEASTGIPIAWAFLGTLHHLLCSLKLRLLTKNKKARTDH